MQTLFNPPVEAPVTTSGVLHPAVDALASNTAVELRRDITNPDGQAHAAVHDQRDLDALSDACRRLVTPMAEPPWRHGP